MPIYAYKGIDSRGKEVKGKEVEEVDVPSGLSNLEAISQPFLQKEPVALSSPSRGLSPVAESKIDLPH